MLPVIGNQEGYRRFQVSGKALKQNFGFLLRPETWNPPQAPDNRQPITDDH